MTTQLWPALRLHSVPVRLLAVLVLAACRDGTAPDTEESDVQPPAAVLWSAVAESAVARTRPFNPQSAERAFVYVSMAQYAAVLEALERGGNPRPSQRAAVAAASAAVLLELFPAQSVFLDSILRAQERAKLEEPGSAFSAGESVGREVAARTVAVLRSDNFAMQWTGVVPTGAGFWFSSATPPAAPLLPLLGQMKPFVLNTGNQFRPLAPPAFGSAAFQTDLAEVRRIADTRTAIQDSIAKFWAQTTGSFTPGFWNAIAARLVSKQRMNERAAAHAFALMNGAAMDALIAAHDAKFFYWVIRPSQADAAIRLAIPLPNFPAYPSNHAAISAAAAGALASVFPAETVELNRMAEEAAISRVYGGIHYRFDADAGLQLGRRILARALEADQAGQLVARFR